MNFVGPGEASQLILSDSQGILGDTRVTLGDTEQVTMAAVGVESVAQAALILVVGVAVIVSNIVVLATFVTMPG